MHFITNIFNKVQENRHTWVLYINNKSVLDAIYTDIENAKSTIYLEAFILYHDSVGEPFLELLRKKASEGVQVKVLVDSVGSLSLGSSVYIQKLKEAGAHIRFFNWLLPFSEHNKRLWYFRNHRRILIIDDEILYTGGFCFGKEMENWRETAIRIKGPILEQAMSVAHKTWRKVYKKRYINLGREWRTNIDGFSFVTHAPLIGERYLYHQFIKAIRQAKKHIYITTPYFLPDHKLYKALKIAKKRGVDVRILLPRKSDHRIVDRASHTYYHSFLTKNINIYQYPEMIHAKTVVIDDDWSMIGTLNMDNISLRYNFECAVVSTEQTCAKQLNDIFLSDLEMSHRVTLKEWEERPFINKMKEWIVWPIRKLL